MAALMALLSATAVGVAAVLGAPSLHGDWMIQPELMMALPPGAALAAWGLRHAPRTGAVLAALTLAASAWLLIGARLDEGTGLAPPRGALPWGGASALPRLVRTGARHAGYVGGGVRPPVTTRDYRGEHHEERTIGPRILGFRPGSRTRGADFPEGGHPSTDGRSDE